MKMEIASMTYVKSMAFTSPTPSKMTYSNIVKPKKIKRSNSEIVDLYWQLDYLFQIVQLRLYAGAITTSDHKMVKTDLSVE